MFTEGWVEFNDKRIAKAVVRSLNGQIIGKSNFSTLLSVGVLSVAGR